MEINKIYNEDNSITLRKMQSRFIDLVITSPPYNTMRDNQSDIGYDVYKDNLDNDEYIDKTLSLFNEFSRVLKDDGVVLYNMSYGGENTTLMNLLIADIIRLSNFTLADIIVWKKPTATPNNTSSNKMTRIVEFVYVFCKKDSFNTFTANKKKTNVNSSNQQYYENVVNFITAKNNDGSNPLNKATYSTEFVRKLLNIYAKDNSLIYDPFMGTGTTALACIIDKHNYIGSEISKSQCHYAEKRLHPYLSQTTLF